MGWVAASNRFISKTMDRYLSFFKAIKKKIRGIWTEECEKVFHDLKDYMGWAPFLSTLMEGERLNVYLYVLECAVSSVLIREDRGVQGLVHYVSKAFEGTKARYLNVEKLALALVTMARKLRPYFMAHRIVVLTNQT